MTAITQQTDLEMSEQAPFHFLDVAVLITDIPLTCCVKKITYKFQALHVQRPERNERSCALTSAPSKGKPFHH
jgi:hypothetical protein